MPGPVSDSCGGPPDDGPYVPSWCYPTGAPLMCPCGHHEGYHGDDGRCLHRASCRCEGLPADRRMPDEAFLAMRGPER
jgi:hypothetical protein